MSRSFFVFRPSESELPFVSYRAREFGVQKWRFVINKRVTANYFANSNNTFAASSASSSFQRPLIDSP
jgi:hypothetical protein